MHFNRNGHFALGTVRERRFRGRGRCIRVFSVQFPIEVLQQVRRICKQSDPSDGVAEIADLFAKRGLIAREVIGQLIDSTITMVARLNVMMKAVLMAPTTAAHGGFSGVATSEPAVSARS
jgi:hypothetical protein